MMKKLIAALLVLAMMSTLMVSLASADGYGFSTMYVNTENRKPLNVRAYPSKDAEVIGQAIHGNAILTDWSYAGNDGWTKVVWGSLGDGYVMTRFLSETKPTTKPYDPKEASKTTPKATPKLTPRPTATDAQDKINKELTSEKEVAPFYVAVRPSRASGWVNFRVGPSAATTRVTAFGDGKELLVLAETSNWYRARDPESNRVGYISKNYVVKINKAVSAAVVAEDGKQPLGKLSVNGEFDLVCKLPDTYKLQVENVKGDHIVASILSDDMTKPRLYLSIAYDDTYSNVERMNDLTDEELAILEKSFEDMNQVEITYSKTDYGTKLLIARETGSDTDFVDILTIYKGYFIEFNMSPNPNAADQTLTNAQIGMCIDFLTNVDFIEAK